MKILKNEYFLFSIIVLISICFMVSGFCCYSYRVYEKKKSNVLLQLTKEISFDLFNIFNENENILKFFGSKIADNIDPGKLNDIFSLLISNVNLNIASMTKSYLSWANAEGKIIVCGKHGIMTSCGKGKLKNKIHKNPDIRDKDYFIFAKKNPWTLQISKPCSSFSGNSYILPTAMGIVNKRQKFIGYLILGLRIEYINHYIEKLISSKKASYILLDQNFKSKASSDENLKSIENIINYNQYRKQMDNFAENNNTILPISFKHNNIKYSFMSKIPEYPFFILLGYDINAYKHDFIHRVNPIFMEFFVMGVIYMVLLYFFRRKIISPARDLSNLIFSSYKDNFQFKIPKQSSREFFRLARRIEFLVGNIKKTKSYVQALELANQIHKDSDNARAEFIKKMHYEFSNYFKQIFIYFNFIYIYMKKNIAIQDQKVIHYSKKIQELLLNFSKKTSDVLTLSYFQINLIIENAVKINLKTAFIKNISIELNAQQQLPKIYADETKIKQVLVSLIRQSVENSPSDSIISIKTSSYVENNSVWLKINIIDRSFGLDETNLEEIQQKFNDNQDIAIFDFTKMSMDTIEKVVLMHRGSLKIINKYQEGRELQLLFPVLEQEDYFIKCDIKQFAQHKFP